MLKLESLLLIPIWIMKRVLVTDCRYWSEYGSFHINLVWPIFPSSRHGYPNKESGHVSMKWDLQDFKAGIENTAYASKPSTRSHRLEG